MTAARTATVGGLSWASDGATDPAGFTGWLDDLKGWDEGPGVRRDRQERLWAHGEFGERGWRDARLITVEGDLVAGGLVAAQAAADRYAAVLADGASGTLTVVDAAAPTKTATVYLASEPKISPISDTSYACQLQLLAPDPRKYGATVSGQTNPPTAGGGLAFPLFSPAPPGVLDFGAAGTPGTVTLQNLGTADTAPRFTATATDAPSGFTVREVATGRRLVYAGAVVAGQTITLDTRDGSVLLDGYADRSSLLTVREWTRLAGGASGTWLFEATGATGAQLTVEVDPAWW